MDDSESQFYKQDINQGRISGLGNLTNQYQLCYEHKRESDFQWIEVSWLLFAKYKPPAIVRKDPVSNNKIPLTDAQSYLNNGCKKASYSGLPNSNNS